MAERILGTPVPGWSPPPRPDRDVISGRYARLERLNAAQHAPGLFRAYRGDDSLWDYMPVGPFADEAAMTGWAHQAEASQDPVFYAITDLETGLIAGQASFLRIAPQDGSIEVGFICFSPVLQRTRAATEAMYLMMRWAFQAGYRRYEWKCNALNQGSRRAAQRLGFSFEGIFRQATVTKGRNRDTAWFACIDAEWPALKTAFDTWLDPGNFDADRQQRQTLSALTAPILAARDPALSLRPGRNAPAAP